jgi:hypothetical protein
VRNAIKGYEQLDKGFAQDAQGRKIIDVTGLGALWQGIGVSSGALAKMYDVDAIDKQSVAFYQQVSADFMHQLVRAAQDGNSAKAQEIYETMRKWDEANPEMPLRRDPAAMRRQIMQAGVPLNRRTLMLLPRQLRAGSVAGEGINE